MSYSQTTATERPAGVTAVVFINAFFTILGYFGSILGLVFGIGFLPTESGGTIILVVAFLLISVFVALYLVLLYGVFRLNKTAYIIFMVFTGIALILNFVSLNIIGIIVQGATFIYLAIVWESF